jgi:uncharacterized protein YggE
MENQMKNMCGGSFRFAQAAAAVLLMVLAVYVAVLAVNAAKANKYIGREVANQATVSVTGNGDVSTPPDLAVMDFSVVSNAKTVDGATADNTKKMNAIVAAEKSLGVADKDLQTTGYNVSPHYDHVKQILTPVAPPPPSATPDSGSAAVSTGGADSSIYYPTGKQVITGYDVTQTLTIKIRKGNMAKIGQIIESATAAGANQAGSLQFTLDNPDAVQAQARKIAIDDAEAKSQVLAKQLGVKLVRITSYSEGGYYPAAQLNYAAKDVAASSAGGLAPNIQTGENKITVNVNITYEIE